MKSTFWHCALLGLFAFHLAANYFWLRDGPCLYGKDVTLRLLANARFVRELGRAAAQPGPPFDKALRAASLFRVRLVPGVNIWTDDTKLGYLVNALIAGVFGVSPVTDLFACNGFWLLVLLVSVYLMGRECLDCRAGWWAACLLSLYPAVFGVSRKFGLDLPQMAAVSLAVLFLMRAGGFRRTGPSFLFGLAVGLGYLVKNSVLVFVAGPWIYSALSPPKRSGETQDPAVRWKGLLLAPAVFLAVSWIWWGSPDFMRLMGEWGIKHATERGYDSITPHGLPRILFYPAYLVEFVSPLLSVMAAAACIPFFTSGVKHGGLIASWLFASLAILTACRDMWGSWCLSVLPPVALITACGLLSVRRASLRRSLLAAGACLACVQFMGLSFGMGGLDNTLRLFGYNEGWYRWELQQTAQYHAWYHPPWKNNYREVMDEFSGLMRPQEYLRVGIVEGRENWCGEDANALEYYLRFGNPWCIIYKSVSVPGAFFDKYRCADYFIVIAPPGEILPVGSDYPSVGGEAFGEMSGVLKGCELLKTATLEPKNFSASLYRRRPFAVRGAAAIPADGFSQGNLFVGHPYAGSDPAAGGALSGEECDSPFPTRVWERPAGEPFYAAYDLLFEKGGTYRLRIAGADSAQYSGPACLFDDIMVEQGADFEVSAGPHRLRLESFEQIPVFSSVAFEPAANDSRTGP